MRKARVLIENKEAGFLMQAEKGYCFQYVQDYSGKAISMTIPVRPEPYYFDRFPAFFDGLLPEGPQLEGLLKSRKIDATDYFSQLLAVGNDMVGAVTVFPAYE